MNEGGVMRLSGMVRQEWLEGFRDPSSIAIAFVLPLLLLLGIIWLVLAKPF